MCVRIKSLGVVFGSLQRKLKSGISFHAGKLPGVLSQIMQLLDFRSPKFRFVLESLATEFF